MNVAELLHQFPETDKQREIFTHKVRELCEHGDAIRVSGKIMDIWTLMSDILADQIITDAVERQNN